MCLDNANVIAIILADNVTTQYIISKVKTRSAVCLYLLVIVASIFTLRLIAVLKPISNIVKDPAKAI